MWAGVISPGAWLRSSRAAWGGEPPGRNVASAAPAASKRTSTSRLVIGPSTLPSTSTRPSGATATPVASSSPSSGGISPASDPSTPPPVVSRAMRRRSSAPPRAWARTGRALESAVRGRDMKSRPSSAGTGAFPSPSKLESTRPPVVSRATRASPSRRYEMSGRVPSTAKSFGENKVVPSANDAVPSPANVVSGTPPVVSRRTVTVSELPGRGCRPAPGRSCQGRGPAPASPRGPPAPGPSRPSRRSCRARPRPCNGRP